MKNVEMTVEGALLTIKVDLSKEFGPSSSGKTIIIASMCIERSRNGRLSPNDVLDHFSLDPQG